MTAGTSWGRSRTRRSPTTLRPRRMPAIEETIANGDRERLEARLVPVADRDDLADGPSLSRPLTVASIGSPGWSRFHLSATVGGPGRAPQVGHTPGLTSAWCPQVSQRHWKLGCMASRSAPLVRPGDHAIAAHAIRNSACGQRSLHPGAIRCDPERARRDAVDGSKVESKRCTGLPRTQRERPGEARAQPPR